jgi:hypothetical protein
MTDNTGYLSKFVLGIADGDELLTFAVFHDADSALAYHCNPENFCTFSPPLQNYFGNPPRHYCNPENFFSPLVFQCVVLFPTLRNQFGDLTLMFGGSQCVIHADSARPFEKSYTFDFVNWESLYHAIARAQKALTEPVSEPKNQCFHGLDTTP